MILGPMLIGILTGLVAAVTWVLTGGSVWVAIGIVYALASTLGLIASASLLAYRSSQDSVSLAVPKHSFHLGARKAERRKRRVAVYERPRGTAVAVRVDTRAASASRSRRT